MPIANKTAASLPAKGSIAIAACVPSIKGILFTKRVAAVATIIKNEKKSAKNAPQ